MEIVRIKGVTERSKVSVRVPSDLQGTARLGSSLLDHLRDKNGEETKKWHSTRRRLSCGSNVSLSGVDTAQLLPSWCDDVKG